MANNPKNINEENDGKKSKKKFLLLLLLLLISFLLIAGIALGVTFARYKSGGTPTDKDIPVAKWGVTTELTDSLHIVDNDYVVDGKIAPASQAYIDVKIKLDGTEVAVDYEITIGTITAPEGSAVPTGLAVEKVVRRNADNTADAENGALTATDGKYTGTIDLPTKADSSEKEAFAANTEFIVRIYFKWTNNEANNTNDTAVGNKAPTLTIPITLIAQQHIEESTGA